MGINNEYKTRKEQQNTTHKIEKNNTLINEHIISEGRGIHNLNT